MHYTMQPYSVHIIHEGLQVTVIFVVRRIAGHQEDFEYCIWEPTNNVGYKHG